MLFDIKRGSLYLAGLSLMAAGTLFAQESFEIDPNPGPPVQAEVDESVTAGDVPTPENTVRFAPPVPLQQRIPAGAVTHQQSGVLSGRIVYTSAGHGWQYNSTLGRWATDRGLTNGMVEDFGNHDQLTYYVNYLFNAGATVVPMRPVGNQTNEIVLDNPNSRVTWSGTWQNSTTSQYYGNASDSVSYRFAVTTTGAETAVATYRPNILVPGFYPIYTWVLNSANRSSDQLYRINHPGGTNEVRIDHRKVGRGWVYLGMYYLEAGTGASVEISNHSKVAGGTNVIADAIRFGNGMGDVVHGPAKSGFSREDEGSRYWIQRMIGQGGDTSVYTNGNVGAPPRMAAYMNNSAVGAMTDRVYIGIHSNAANTVARGAVGLYNDFTEDERPADYGKTPNQYSLALITGRELNLDMRALPTGSIPATWSNRTVHTYTAPTFNYGELHGASINYEMDATIIETAFHDNADDAAIMRNHYGRMYIARAMLHGTIKYFQTHGGGAGIFPPNPPLNPRVNSNGNGTVTVRWTAPPSDPTGSGAPTSYLVYRSTNGYSFGNPITVTGSTQTNIAALPTESVTYFRIASRNNAGESFPTETIAVRPAPVGTNPVLIVNAFDRIDAAMNIRESSTNIATHDRVKAWRSNNFDYVVPHAKALLAADRYFDSASKSAINAAVLSSYDALVWIAGESSSNGNTFNSNQQTWVTSFLSSGKDIFVSGAEIGWDLEYRGNGQTFYNSALMTDFVSDDAGTYNVNAGVGIFAGVPSFSFGPIASVNDTSYPPTNAAFYDADYPDVINPLGGASRVLSYSTGTGAAIAGTAASGSKVVSLGFPFENITNETRRAQVMTAAMNFMGIRNSNVSDWQLY